jgi:hypothetical protein
MKMKFGALVVDGRGKIGGHVASKNRAGAYLRTKVTPVNPNTSAQSSARNRLTTISQGWRALTAAARASFNNAVQDFTKTDIFGDVKSPSGFNLYQRLNNNLSNIGAAAITVAPLASAVPTVIIGALVFDITTPTYTVGLSASVPAGSAMEIWATPGLSAGISFVKSEYRLIQVEAAASTSPVDIETAYLARYGAPVAGQKVFVQIKFVNILTGQASTTQSASTIVIA